MSGSEYDSDDEDWRRGPARREAKPKHPRREVTEAVGAILTREEKLAGLGLDATAPAPVSTARERQVCRRCGCESQVLHSLAGERVRLLNGLELVGTVRTTCGECITQRMTASEARQR